MDFCDWMAQRCGGQIDDASGATVEKATKTMLEVVQTIALLSTISEREGDQNVVTLSTLHASKGLEWPHVMLASCVEGLLPFKLGDDDGTDSAKTESIALRLQEERRLMYVGITRAQRTLAVNWLRKRKKGRDMIPGVPSRFIAEMALDKATIREDPREKLKASGSMPLPMPENPVSDNISGPAFAAPQATHIPLSDRPALRSRSRPSLIHEFQTSQSCSYFNSCQRPCILRWRPK